MKNLATFLCLLLFGLTTYSQDDTYSLRLMTYNIRHGAGMDDVIDLDRQASVISAAIAVFIFRLSMSSVTFLIALWTDASFL